MAQSSAENFLASDKKVIAPLYGKPDVNFVSGEGSYLTDASGKKYLDMTEFFEKSSSVKNTKTPGDNPDQAA